MKEEVHAYKEKLEKAIKEYMTMPASERSATAIMSMVECWSKLDAMCEDMRKPMTFTHEDAIAWNRGMRNTDGTNGGHWNIEQTNGVASAVGVTFDHITDWCWNTALNMMYSDYGNVAAYFGVSTPEFYGEMAKAFLFDPDGPGPMEKLAGYYHCVTEKSKKESY